MATNRIGKGQTATVNPAFAPEFVANDLTEQSVDGFGAIGMSAKHRREAVLGHVLMENRNGLAVDCIVTPATGTAEREAALKMLATAPQAKTVGADKGYDVADFVTACREQGVTHM